MRKILIIRRKGKLKMKSRSILQLHYKINEKQYIREYPLRDLEAVLIIGSNVFIESSALSVLPTYNIPITVVAKNSTSIQFNPIIIINPHYRKLQYTMNKIDSLQIALEYIKSKINGMINIIKYYKINPPNTPNPPEPYEDPRDFEQKIRIWESTSSSKLWPSLTRLINPDYMKKLKTKYGFTGRKPRHPDPFNKTLSIMYAVLYSLATKALLAAGLDPTYGFLHRTRYSTPLTFDYTEMFKPIAIHGTIKMINEHGLPELDKDNELKRKDINLAIKTLYQLLTLQNKITKRSVYTLIFLKARCLAKYLEGECTTRHLTFTWNKRNYTKRKQ